MKGANSVQSKEVAVGQLPLEWWLNVCGSTTPRSQRGRRSLDEWWALILRLAARIRTTSAEAALGPTYRCSTVLGKIDLRPTDLLAPCRFEMLSRTSILIVWMRQVLGGRSSAWKALPHILRAVGGPRLRLMKYRRSPAPLL
jgi:hypothetical protein